MSEMNGFQLGVERVEELLRASGEKEKFDRGRLAGNLLVGQVMKDWRRLGHSYADLLADQRNVHMRELREVTHGDGI